MENREQEIRQDREDLIEGRNAVAEAIRAGRTIDKIFVARGDTDRTLARILAKARENGIVVTECDRRKLDSLSATGAHQGIIAQAAMREYASIEDILERAAERGEDPFIVVCDEIADPHNLGAILRTAECAGVHGVIIPKRRAAGLTAVVDKASAGAAEHMLVSRVTNIPAALGELKKKGLWVYGTAADAPADLWQTKMTGPAALVIGSEGFGMGRLVSEQCDFTVGIPMDTPIAQAERVVSAGKGIGEKKNMKLVEALAKAAGAAIGSSRPVAETLKYLPLNRYVGMSGQKFTGNLYIACGISGASQHLKGIKDASTIVAINKNGNAPIFKNCDYGIVGDVEEILPLLTAALDSGEKLPAPPMVKMKRPTPPKPAPIGDRYVCSGCGYEYVPELGDEDGEIAPGTLFEQLPAEWVCPECAETKDQFVKA